LLNLNGDYYDGNFSQGKIQGNGMMKFMNGDIYDGEWKDN